MKIFLIHGSLFNTHVNWTNAFVATVSYTESALFQMHHEATLADFCCVSCFTVSDWALLANAAPLMAPTAAQIVLFTSQLSVMFNASDPNKAAESVKARHRFALSYSN